MRRDVVELPTFESELRHIFHKAEGHVADSSANRAMLLEVANDTDWVLAADRYGNEWAAKVLPDGRQVWTQVRTGKLINGGINDRPRSFNASTGLKSL